MPNWWQTWAERIAAALAESWLRSGGRRGEGSGPPPHPPRPQPPRPSDRPDSHRRPPDSKRRR